MGTFQHRSGLVLDRCARHDERRCGRCNPFHATPQRKERAMTTIDTLCATRLVPVVVLDDAADAIRVLADRGDILVGAGTVLTPDQVDQAVAAGATFVVSPGLSRAVVERCREHGVLPLPGAVTATDIQAAMELGPVSYTHLTLPTILRV